MSKSIMLVTLLLSSALNFAHAQLPELNNDPVNQITSVSVNELKTATFITEVPQAPSQIGEIIAIVDGVMAIGERIWKIVEAGKPVVTTKFSPSISALPEMEGEGAVLRKMANWSVPKIKSYRVSLKNRFNQEKVAFTYTVFFQFNGSYKGKGKYITNLKVQASDVYVAWGFNFDAASELIGIANVGSDEAPVASAIIQISYAARSLNEVRDAQSFYVDGAGNVQVIP
jgi:hypothetical protein